MKKDFYYLGIDLGTSSVKGIAKSISGHSVKAKRPYPGDKASDILNAVKLIISDLKEQLSCDISAIAVSSQVGTYIVNGNDIISWQSHIGKEELDHIKGEISDEEFISEIGMKHPYLISYPLPRLLYIKKHYGDDAEVLMPKEILIRKLTGETVSDVFSMRGIANPQTLSYANGLMNKLGIRLTLPKLKYPTDLAGYVTGEAANDYGLKEGTPVYLGCNDFFAGLIGMGIYEPGDAFDLSGTSEHIGYISNELNENAFVCGSYFNGNCTYGGTKSSGASCNLAIENFNIDGIDIERALSNTPPIFLPYLCGERAPIFDESARGVYFGLNDKSDRESLAYATLEGVVFSLYDIAKSMNMPHQNRIICGGGSARNMLMNSLRATLFECDVVSVADNDTSALGACILAMVGNGAYPDITSAIQKQVSYLPAVHPMNEYRDILIERFNIYKEVYKDVQDTFKKFSKLEHKKGENI